MIRTVLLASLVFAAVSPAQTSRESYRAPYREWRQKAPALETEAAAAPPGFSTEAAAQGAQAFFNAKAAYLAVQPSSIEQTAWVSEPLATAEASLAVPQNVEQLLAVRAARLGNEVNAFKADDKDAAIRRLRQAIERERAALRAVTDSLAARKAALNELIDSSDDAEIERAKTYQALNAANGRRTQIVEHVKREATAWSKYYANLAEAASASSRVTAGATNPGAAPAKIVRPAGNGFILMARYTGEWEFPSKGLFYGPQPESVEVKIQENAGTITGSLSAKFLAPARIVNFDFQGPVLQQNRTQTFSVQSGGGTGTIELIPGSAINLLEVNFVTPETTGNFILVKK